MSDPSTPTGTATDSALDGKTILFADDDGDVLASLEAAFEPTGANILTARNGNQAVSLAEAENPDLIVLDVMMPGRSGFLAAEKIKQGKLPSEKPYLIMITANDGQRHQIYAESQIGVNAYFHKPVPLEKLLNTAEELLAGE
ncbi:MAG: response regulator [Planctomycetota bacterium]